MALADDLRASAAAIYWLIDARFHVAKADDISFSGSVITTVGDANFADLPRHSRLEVEGSSSNDTSEGAELTVLSSTATTITVEETLVNESAGATITIRSLRLWSNRPFDAGASDSVEPSRRYVPLLDGGPGLDVSIVDGDSLGPSSAPDTAEVDVVALEGDLDDLFEHDRTPDGIDQTIRLGSGDTQDLGTGMQSFVFSGVDLVLDDAGEIATLEMRSKDRVADRNIQTNRLAGYGGMVSFDGSTSRSVTVAHSSPLAHTAWLGVRVLFRLNALPSVAGSIMQLVCKDGLGAGDEWAVYLDATDRVRCVLREDTTTTAFGVTGQTLGAAHVGVWLELFAVWNGADIRLYFGGALDPAGATAFAGVAQQTSQPVYVGQSAAGTTKLNGDVAEVAVFANASSAANAWTATQVAEWALKPLDRDEGHDDLALLWRFDERQQLIAGDDSGNQLDGTVSASDFWGSTATGEYEQAGKPQPMVVGYQYVHEPIRVDNILRVYRVHDRKCKGIGPVSSGGSNYELGFSVTSSDIAFDATAKTITLGTTLRLTFDWLGVLNGQEVDVQGSLGTEPNHNFNDILTGPWSATTITVVDSTGMTTHAAGTHTYTITFYDGTGTKTAANCQVDHEAGTLTLAGEPTYPIRCAVRGDVDPTDGYTQTLSGVWVRILKRYLGLVAADYDGASVTAHAALTTAPVGVSLGREDRKARDVLDMLVGGDTSHWGGNHLTGKLELVRRIAPTGAADVTLDEASHYSAKRLRSAPAITSKQVLWGRHENPLTQAELAGVITLASGWGQRLTQQWQVEPAVAAAAVDALHPVANPGVDLESLFAGRGGAKTAVQRAYDLDSVAREFFGVEANLDVLLVALRGSVYSFTNGDFPTTSAGKLFTGLRLRVTKGDADTATVTLWG